MRILGVEMRTPCAAESAALFVVILLSSALAWGLTSVVEGLDPVMVISGATGGALASAYGASIQQYGWRALVIAVGFSSILMGIVKLFDFV